MLTSSGNSICFKYVLTFSYNSIPRGEQLEQIQPLRDAMKDSGVFCLFTLPYLMCWAFVLIPVTERSHPFHSHKMATIAPGTTSTVKTEGRGKNEEQLYLSLVLGQEKIS